MYKLERRRRPNRFDWTEALQTLKRMKPGKAVAFYVPIPEADSLSLAMEGLGRAAEAEDIHVQIEQERGWVIGNRKRGLWVWRV